MAFAVPQPFCKRLKAMEPNGKEVREGWDPMDMSYMQLLDASGPTEDASAEAEEAPPDPSEIIKIFEDAKGNLDILVDVVTNLDRAFIEAKHFTAGRRPGVRREDAVANSLQSRVAATSAALGRVSSRLAAGAELLQAHVDREDCFYQQLRQLQMFWKVHHNPRVIDCPFIVDLSLPEPLAPPCSTAAAAAAAAEGGGAAAAVASSSVLAAGQALTGNTYELGGGSLLVPLMKDDSGALRVQLELPEERPDVNDAVRVGETRLNGKGARTQLVVGSRRVHALLLQLQRRQLWRQVAAGLERDAATLGFGGGGTAGGMAGGGGTAGGGGHPVHVSLARLAAQNVLCTSDSSLASLRPLMLEHLLACRLPPPYKPPPPRPASLSARAAAAGAGGLHLPLGAAAAAAAASGGAGVYGGGLAGLPLLPDLAALLNHMVFRGHQVYHLDLEAHALPYVTLRWRPCSTSMLTSAMEIRVGPRHRVLLLVRDGRTDVEGVVQATGGAAGSGAGGSRWVRDTHMGFSRHDVPCVLRSVLQTLGLPLDRLLGVSVPAQHTPHHLHSHHNHHHSHLGHNRDHSYNPHNQIHANHYANHQQQQQHYSGAVPQPQPQPLSLQPQQQFQPQRQQPAGFALLPQVGPQASLLHGGATAAAGGAPPPPAAAAAPATASVAAGGNGSQVSHVLFSADPQAQPPHPQQQQQVGPQYPHPPSQPSRVLQPKHGPKSPPLQQLQLPYAPQQQPTSTHSDGQGVLSQAAQLQPQTQMYAQGTGYGQPPQLPPQQPQQMQAGLPESTQLPAWQQQQQYSQSQYHQHQQPQLQQLLQGSMPVPAGAGATSAWEQQQRQAGYRHQQQQSQQQAQQPQQQPQMQTQDASTHYPATSPPGAVWAHPSQQRPAAAPPPPQQQQQQQQPKHHHPHAQPTQHQQQPFPHQQFSHQQPQQLPYMQQQPQQQQLQQTSQFPQQHLYAHHQHYPQQQQMQQQQPYPNHAQQYHPQQQQQMQPFGGVGVGSGAGIPGVWPQG